jgi:hypothetical protein
VTRPPTAVERLLVMLTSMVVTRLLSDWWVRRYARRTAVPAKGLFQMNPPAQSPPRDYGVRDGSGIVLNTDYARGGVVPPWSAAERTEHLRRIYGAYRPEAN